MPSDKPHVLILGAGLGGLALAQALRKQGISYEIFERDAALHSRFQGWAIALHFIIDDLQGSMPSDMPPLSVTNHLLPRTDIGPSVRMFDEKGDVKANVEGLSEHELIRANRARLRDYLATNLHIHWGKHMTRIEESGDAVTLHFADGTSATGDILVGADGVHSPVRRHLLGEKDKLNTLPLGIIVGETTLDREQTERQLKLAHSAYVVASQGQRMFVGLNSIGEDAQSGKYYWIMNWEDPEAAKEPYWTHHKSKKELYDIAVERAKELPKDQREVIDLTSPEGILMPPLVIRDMILTEMPNRRVTLLGDAAHPMTPFRGEGGNNALLDSLKLARAITKSNPDDLLANLKEYQDEMLDRGSKAVKKSREATTDNGQITQEAWKDWVKSNGGA